MEFQDEGVAVDNTDPGASEDQPHDATMGPQGPNTYDIDLHIGHYFSPAPDPGQPGPSRASRHRQVFDVGPDSEPEEEGDGDGEYISTSPYRPIHDSRPIGFRLRSSP